MPNADNAGAQGADDPRKNDYAIVIAITRYPKLIRDGKPADLRGPINDANKVREWLASEKGGGVPSENIVHVFRGADTPDAKADPARDAVVDAFTCMWGRCWRENGAPIVPKGRRLYVYVSGHGLCDLNHGALLCSNSSKNSYATVEPYRSILDFRKAGFFQEFVIWFDGCMDWTSVATQPIDFQPPAGDDLDPPGPIFAVYAAHPRLKTVEAADDGGDVRGVFTRALLKGLEGGAAAGGKIDSVSLENYLYNAMPNYLPVAVWEDKLVDKQPYIVKMDQRAIVFRTTDNVQLSSIVFQIGAQYDGAQAQLWGRRQAGLEQLDSQVIANATVTFSSVPKGIYFVVVPQHGLRQGFEVIGGVATKLSEA